jgi:hypothetical protein
MASMGEEKRGNHPKGNTPTFHEIKRERGCREVAKTEERKRKALERKRKFKHK